ncbi:MAG: hypothetical protein ABSG81_14810, partial [Acidimicrobiales bacterium]
MLAATAVAGAVVSLTGPASATKAPPINASNYEVICGGQKGTAQFSPALIDGAPATGTDSLKIKATLSDCQTTAPHGGAPLRVKKGTVTGTLTGTRGHSCSLLEDTLSNGGNLPFTGSLSIKWSTTPKITSGVTVVTAPSADLGFTGSDNSLTIPGITRGTVSGSFSSNPSQSFSYSVSKTSVLDLVSQCGGSGLQTLATTQGVADLGTPPTSVTVTPTNPDVLATTPPTTAQFVATGHYLTQFINLTQLATWASSDTSVATMGTPQALCSLPGSTVGACIDASMTTADESTGATSTISATVDGVTGDSLLTSVVPVQITTDALPDATVGMPYSFTVTAVNGLPPYTWSTFGPVGDGFTFNPATGMITNPGPPEAGTGDVD